LITAATATVAVIAGGLVLAAFDGESPVVSSRGPVTEGPVTTTPPPSDEELAADDDASSRVGFIGLPPEGATPSTPQGGEVVVWIYPCQGPFGVTGEFAGLSELDRLPPLGELWVLADGRLIWQKYEDLPEGANQLSTGLLEQRLTPEGVDLMRSEAAAALSSGEPQNCGPDAYYDAYGVTVGSEDNWQALRDDDEHLARIIDPWSWLPATAWADREIRAYVPTTYLVSFSPGGLRDISLDEYTAHLPEAAVELICTKPWTGQLGSATFAADEARALAAALDDAGLERDGLLNAYQLDYQFEFQHETPDGTVTRDESHIVFSARDLEAMLWPPDPYVQTCGTESAAAPGG
jgi:hypothetical protein